MSTSAVPTLAPKTLRPYIGLRYFTEEDAPFFFGRDENVVELLGKLAANRFVAVLGSSASGKSSLVRAGLLPELRSGMIPKAGPNWKVFEFKPGRDPLGELANAINVPNARQVIEEGPLGIVNALAAANLTPRTNVLIIADQFEEVFRYQREESAQGLERAAAAAEQCQSLVRRLLDATDDPGIPIYVLLVMRSDYLGECAQFPDLPERMSASLYLAPRLRRDQLQEAITAPVGGNIESALVQRLMNEAGTDPDQLPRLQHLLCRMWDLAKGQRITMQHYIESGGWEQALEQHLNEVFDKQLDAPQRNTARRVFQQLSELDRGRAIRRRVELLDLQKACGSEASTVVEKFKNACFLSVQSNVVDICHECVLRNWSKAQQWLKEELAARDFYLQLIDRQKRKSILSSADMQEVRRLKNAGFLVEEWSARYGSATDFENVKESIRHSQSLLGRNSFAKWLLISLVAVAIFSFTASSKRQERNSRARELTAYAAMNQTQDPARALYFGLAAARIKASTPPPALQAILTTALNSGPSLAALYGHTGAVTSVAWSPDGKNLASASADSTIRLWNAQSTQWLRTLNGHQGIVESVAWSPDSKTIASASDDGTVRLWNAESGQLLRTVSRKFAIKSLSWSPDGKIIAAVVDDQTIQLFDLAIGQWTRTFRHSEDISIAVAWSPDSKTLAWATSDDGIQLSDAASGKFLKTFGRLNLLDSYPGAPPDGGALAWSPDGKTLASSGQDDTVQLWDVGTEKQFAILRGNQSYVSSLAWNPDGMSLASSSSDKTIRVWAHRTVFWTLLWRPDPVQTFSGQTQKVSVAWSPDGKMLASASLDPDHAIRLWELDRPNPAKTFDDLLTQVQNSIRLFGLSKDDCQRYFQKDSCPPMQ